jgi:hypothetical protein
VPDPLDGDTDDPLSADRRVLIFGAAAMVALILVGGLSAAIFTRSACGRIAPDPALPRAAGDDVEAVVGDGLADLFDDERETLLAWLHSPEVTGHLGQVVAAADVTGAERLVPAAEGRVAATGATTTLFDPASGDVHETATFGEGTVVGDGDTLYSLALTNPMTGQTDAIVPLDRSLEGGECHDTATVGTPLAFLLEAGGGELLLFRGDEDGDAPLVELRDADRRRVWSTPLQTPQIPPGVTGERLTAGMDHDTVVVARRFDADDEMPALSGFERTSGEQRWTTPPTALDEVAPTGDGAVWVEVVAVDGDTALLAIARDSARDAALLIAVDTADGAVRWVADVTPGTPLAAAITADAVTVVALTGDDLEVVRLDRGDGSATGSAGTPIEGDGQRPDRGGVATLPGGTLAAAGTGVVYSGADGVTTLGYDPAVAAQIVDVVSVDGVTVLLIASGDGAVAVAFGPS